MADTFLVMTFNICRDRRACWDNDGTLCSWHVRKPAILKLIQTYSPDIIQLQELRDFKKRDDKPDVEPIAAFLGDPVFYPYERFISRDSGEPSTMACGVLWKTKRFRALQARSISLGKSWGFPDPIGGDHRPCSAAWVQVCPVENLQSGGFEVVSAHITMPQEYRIAEAANLFSMLNLTATSRLIVGGDFNCFPDRGAHEQLLPFSRSKWLMEVPANSALALTNNTQSCQVFPTTGTWNGFPHDFPTAPGETGARLDRMYFTHSAFGLVSSSVCVDSLVPGPNGELPGSIAVSDHLPIVAKFEALQPPAQR